MHSNRPLTKLNMIRQFLLGAKRYFLLGVTLACLSTLLDMVRPKIVEYTVDGILGDVNYNLPGLVQGWLNSIGGLEHLKANLWIPALAVLLCTGISALLRYFYQLNTAKGSERFVKTMRDRLFGHIQKLDTQWHTEHQTGDIIQRCTTDVEMVKNFLAEQLVSLVSMLITIVLAMYFLFSTSWKLGLVVLAAVPVLVVYSCWFRMMISRSFQACDEAEGELSTIAQENLTGVRVVRAFGREASEQKRFEQQNQTVTGKWIHLGKYLCTYWFCADFITGAMMLAVLAWGSALSISGELTVGGLLAVVSYLTMLNRPVRNLGRVISEMSKTGVSMQRLLEIMQARPEADCPDADCPDMTGDIVFDHVCFSYPNQPQLLHDISFTVPAGTTLGILGGTGSGKSTLAHLLSRLYPLEPENGTITVGGRDIQSMQARWVRQNVGFVLQEPFLFSRSIAENIAITQPEVDMARVRKASAAACLERAVDEFPSGFSTFVGERGVTLSGGQKQRCAIARTLTQNTPILIFDDSLSAVDAQTDAAIRENLKTYMGKATVILISHRITTLMAADQIMVLENGRITQLGSHTELSGQDGLYRTICDIQLGKEVV